MAGQPLAPGGFLSPELSFDGKTILFAYVEQADRPRPRSYRDHDGGWGDPAICFHVFRVNVDGSDLRQLTDGG
jgi:Tol biopolymer transport system component